LVAAATGLRTPPRFEVDLSLPPEERWREVALAYRDVLPGMLAGFEGQMWKPAVPGEDGFPGTKAQGPSQTTDWWMRHHNLNAEHMAELAGIVRLAAHPEVTLRRLILFQELLEEISTEPHVARLDVVGVLACDPNGTVVHGRNIAYSFNFIARGRRISLGELALDLTFTRGGKPLFAAIGFPGRIGVTSGSALGGHDPVSVTGLPLGRDVDYDRVLDVTAAKDGGIPMQLAVRDALTAGLGFRATVHRLMRRPLNTPASFLIAGSGPCQGALVETVSEALLGSPPLKEEFFASQAGIATLNPKVGWWHLVKSKSSISMPSPTDVDNAVILHDVGRENVTPAGILSVLGRLLPIPANAIVSAVDSPALGTEPLVLSRV